jgi:hypothetical protein
VDFKSIPGANPEIILLGQDGSELRRIDISGKTRKEINDFLTTIGFFKKSAPGEAVPPEKISGPYHSLNYDEL